MAAVLPFRTTPSSASVGGHWFSLFILWICFLICLRIRVDSLCLNLPRETAGSECVIYFFLRGFFFFFSGTPSTTSSMNLSRGKWDGCLAAIVSWVYMSV